MYAEYHYRHRNYTALEGIFARSLRQTMNSVELWRLYLRYVREKNAYVEGEDAADAKSKKTTIAMAFEAAVAAIGGFYFSSSLWHEYLEWIKHEKVESFYEEQQKMDLLRKTYVRATSVPIAAIESIWKEYDAFESDLNKITAKKLLADRSAAYMTARSAFKEVAPIVNAIRLELPPLPVERQTREHLKQMGYFQRLVAWEKGNPLTLDDPSQLRQRVIFAYRLSIAYLRFTPQIWYSAATYLMSVGMQEDAAAIFKDAAAVLPDSLLIHFTHADFAESSGRVEAATAVYEDLIARFEAQLNAAFSDELSKGGGSEAIDAFYENTIVVRMNSDAAIKTLIEKWTHVYVQFMRFAKRSDEGVKCSRAIFSRARKYFACTPQIFVAAAQLEFFFSKEPAICTKIFELGLKKFMGDATFTTEYLKMLIVMNDDTNTKSLFERVASAAHISQSHTFWHTYLQHVINWGSLSEIQRLQQRMAETFDDFAYENVETYASRYTFLNLSVQQDIANKRQLERIAQEDAKKEATDAERSTNDSARKPKPNPPSSTDCLMAFIQALPPLAQYEGPVMPPEDFLKIMSFVTLPSSSSSAGKRDRRSVNSGNSRGRHRKRSAESSDEERDSRQRRHSASRRSLGSNDPQSPAAKRDLFKSRHQKRYRPHE